METTQNTTLDELRADVIRRVKDEDITFVQLWFTDVVGRLKSFAITQRELEDAVMHGMGFDGSSVTGFNAIEESDMIAMPDPTSFRVLPWASGERAVARMICDVRTPAGDPYFADSRHVLRCALERMRSLGFDAFNVGPELEFFYFKLDDNGRPTPLDAGGYFEETTLDASADLRKHTVLALEQMGIPIEYLHHEVGPSQHEIDMRYTGGLEMADHCITYRSVVKEVAKRHGVYATFMPKPLYGVNGSGMHTHQSLFTQGENAFYEGDDRWYLSDIAKSFIAGQLRHAREISLLFAQWANSYKRLVPGLRGAGVRRLVAAQPLGADPGAAVPPRQGRGHPGRDPLPRSGLQPVSGVRRHSCTRAWRGSSAATSCPTRWRRTCTRSASPSGTPSASSPCPSRWARRSTSPRSPTWSKRRSGSSCAIG